MLIQGIGTANAVQDKQFIPRAHLYVGAWESVNISDPIRMVIWNVDVDELKAHYGRDMQAGVSVNALGYVQMEGGQCRYNLSGNLVYNPKQRGFTPEIKTLIRQGNFYRFGLITDLNQS